MGYNVSELKLRMYKDCRERVIRILDTIDKIIMGQETEKQACRSSNINYLWFRRFTQQKIDADADTNGRVYINATDWGCWQEDFLRDLTGEHIPRPDGFEEIFEKITKTQLREEEYEVLAMRYQEGMTLEDIGENIGRTAERARQILSKVMRHLRMPQYRLPLCYGLPYDQALEEVHTAQTEYDKLYEQRRKEAISELSKHADNAQQKALDIRIATSHLQAMPLEDLANLKNVPLENLGLSVRSYNALYHYFIRHNQDQNVQNVADLAGHLKSVRGLGTTSIQEITKVMMSQFAIDMTSAENKTIS